MFVKTGTVLLLAHLQLVIVDGSILVCVEQIECLFDFLFLFFAKFAPLAFVSPSFAVVWRFQRQTHCAPDGKSSDTTKSRSRPKTETGFFFLYTITSGSRCSGRRTLNCVAVDASLRVRWSTHARKDHWVNKMADEKFQVLFWVQPGLGNATRVITVHRWDSDC